LRLYTLPDVDPPLRTRAINLFGRLLEQFPYDAQKALSEWDEGRYP
jgi:hypothetical protein